MSHPESLAADLKRARGNFTNGERLTVAGWDAAGNPVASDGCSRPPGATYRMRTRPPRTPAKARAGLKSHHRL